MSPRAALGLLVALCLASGCEEHLVLGATCSRTSECNEPLACVLGRCREECAGNRDCSAGALCLPQADGLRGCEIIDEGCSDRCAAPLTCRDGRCFLGCAGDAECGDGVCVEARCIREDTDGGVRADAGRDAGVLDGGSRDSGPRDAGRRDAGPTPRDAGARDAGLATFPAHESCTARVDGGGGCSAGQVCVEHRWMAPTCRTPCASDAECDAVHPLSRCVQLEDPVSFTNGTYCSVPCNPFDATGCLPDHGCMVLGYQRVLDGAYVDLLDCISLEETTVGVGGPCVNESSAYTPSLCAAGMDCVGIAGPPPYACYPFCVIGARECGAGACCVEHHPSELYGGARVGACLPIDGACME